MENIGNKPPSLIESDTHYSSFRAKLIEHIFISDLLQEAWLRNGRRIEVLRPEVDDSGYDLVLISGPVIRFVQLKTSRKSSTTSEQNVNLRLCERPGGCVLWIIFEEDQQSGRLHLSYRFFGPGPGETLTLDGSLKVTKHTKANKQSEYLDRPMHRVLPKRYFTPVQGGVAGMISLLFGDEPV